MSTTFAYKARDANGGMQRGVLAGESSAAVARSLSGMGWVPVEIKAQAGGRGPAGAAPTGIGSYGGPAGSGGAAAAGAAGARPGAGGRPGAAASAGTRAAPPGAARAGASAGGAGAGGRGPGGSAAPGGASTDLQIELPRWLTRMRPGVRKREQAAFAMVLRELAALLRAGVPLMRALKLVADACSEPGVSAALHRIARDLDAGHDVTQAAEHEREYSGLLGSYDVAMIQIGEKTGRLQETFLELHRHREFTRATQDQVAQAVRYPTFVILTCAIAVVIVNIWVLPSFAKVFAKAKTELPPLTILLMGISGVLSRWWPIVSGAAAGAVFAWKRWTASAPGRLWWDRVKLKLPIVGPILSDIVLSRLTASLASCSAAGLTISDAIAVTARTVDNRWFEVRLQQMCGELARGTSIASAARNMGVLPPTLNQLFAIGEEAGQLEELMREISHHYQSQVDFATKRLSSALEPLLVWFLGVGLLVLALGVFMPMWDMGKAQMR